MARSSPEAVIKWIGSAVAVGTVLLGAAQFIRNQSVEAAKPYLEKKLKWCEEAVEVTAFIATSEAAAAKTKIPRFWQMYWGVLGMVESQQITNAMIEFGKALDARDNLESKSLTLAHSCRQEMAESWSPIWRR
jgi:hypothetical protein